MVASSAKAALAAAPASVKRRKSAAPVVVPATVAATPRPTTPTALAAKRPPPGQDLLAFLDGASGAFSEEDHAAPVYCCPRDAAAAAKAGVGAAALPPAVRTKGTASGAIDLGLPGLNPFQIIDFNDKHGLWHGEPTLLKVLGEDPAKELRGYVEGEEGAKAERSLPPTGLKNLGATCYLNSLVQYLCFNADFRHGLLSASSESQALKAMQRVVALLAAGDRSTVDPSDFVSAAGIDAVEQADATELSALLFDWLERELDKAAAASSMSTDTPVDDAAAFAQKGGYFIRDLFRGEVCQTLQCQAQKDHVFERREHFYELRARLAPEVHEPSWLSGKSGTAKCSNSVVVPPVFGDGGEAAEAAVAQLGASESASSAALSSTPRPAKKLSGSNNRKKPVPKAWLEQLLEESAFPEEMLEGQNQYHCDKCNGKVDAHKSVRPTRLPPYLHVTIERYHYDLKKLERRKLNHIVSFPRCLQLWQTQTDGSRVLVAYECVGFLEHLSATAQSGHYTATLLQDDENAPTAACAESKSTTRDVAESPAKRLKTGDGSLRKGQQQCKWWKMDDDSVSPVTWVPAAAAADGPGFADAAADAARGKPRRIESSGAYLLLYRRADYTPGSTCSAVSKEVSGVCGGVLPDPFASIVGEKNAEFAAARRKHAEKAELTRHVMQQRRAAIQALSLALRNAAPVPSTGGGPKDRLLGGGLSVIPAAWLNTFLRGEEMFGENGTAPKTHTTDGAVTVVSTPVVEYGPALLVGADKAGKRRLVLDPLAVWCGWVKLVPTCALDGLSGHGGLDGSLFLPAEEAMHGSAAKSVWQLFEAWRKEQDAISIVLQNKLTAAAMKAVSGNDDSVTWVSTAVLNSWQKALNRSAVPGGAASRLRAQWREFLSEVREARYTPADELADSAADACSKDVGEDGADEATKSYDVVLTTGLLCPHGLMCRPKGGSLVPRRDMQQLLEASRAKERAYKDHWPGQPVVPRVRTGLLGGRLLAFDDCCPDCQNGAEAQGGEMQQHNILVRQRYASGVTRKKGNLTIAADDQKPLTVARLSEMVQAKLGLPVARLFVPGEASGSEDVELRDGSIINRSASVVIVEKDENAVLPEREAAAFESCIFRAAA
eukprot:TRINITY_DN17559_c0_g1_i2.p1 TRINITY_DN17559_c0_g1~~TRINITY_DN17559_c0_g1_i2.p1  ORF type:complete len:1116 (+),score=274.30 TRINITY_DN17559_c0_g1_i2:100-3447(+)